jgi:hypothetical protein
MCHSRSRTTGRVRRAGEVLFQIAMSAFADGLNEQARRFGQ